MRDAQYADRRDAGRQLGAALARFKGPDTIVLGLPRGGVPVAYEVARSLGVPLHVFVVRKLGVPGQRELAMGALASGGARVLNDDLIRELRIPAAAIEAAVAEESKELARRERIFGSGGGVDLRGRTVILVDDGLATGATMRAAVQAVRALGPSKIVVAAPVGAPDTCGILLGEADVVVCLWMPANFSAVGLWYRDFAQTTDEEVRTLLESAAGQRQSSSTE